jgi:hypothetical protein
MTQIPAKQPIRPDETAETSLEDAHAARTSWECRYRPERKLWIFRKVKKSPRVLKQA